MQPDPLEPILARFSCRAFLPDPIFDADLKRLLEAMRRAPSAGNMQPWRFILVRGQRDRDALSDAAYEQTFISEAPVAIVVCADPERSASRYGDRGRNLYVYQDTAAAVENLMIAATALGYAACWVGAFDEERARTALQIPLHLRPVAIVPVGKPAVRAESSSRRPMSEIVEMR